MCKLIKQRFREICPSVNVFLDVEDLESGSGTKEVDHSRCILVFAIPIYFEKFNCVKEFNRAIVRKKQICLLLPDSEVHGEFTQAMIRQVVTDAWVEKWHLQKITEKWRSEWGTETLQTPSATEMCDALFKEEPLEWSRLSAFQDRTMVLLCQRLLSDEIDRNIYLQGTPSLNSVPTGRQPVKVYCSPHNRGAAELINELNKVFMSASRRARVPAASKEQEAAPLVSSSLKGNAIPAGSRKAFCWKHVNATRSMMFRSAKPEQLLETVSDIHEADHVLVYLNALTWTGDVEALAADIDLAYRYGVHLQPCHEFPSLIDPGSARHALPFKLVMDATPAVLRASPTNIYSQIAVPLKGGDLRMVGLINLALRLSTHVPLAPVDLAQRPAHAPIEDASPPRLGFVTATGWACWSLRSAAAAQSRRKSRNTWGAPTKPHRKTSSSVPLGHAVDNVQSPRAARAKSVADVEEALRAARAARACPAPGCMVDDVTA